jgi:8-oxo-dGTP pyrophosphatase MutT (NUDIX family)
VLREHFRVRGRKLKRRRKPCNLGVRDPTKVRRLSAVDEAVTKRYPITSVAFDIETIRRRLRAREAKRQVVPTPRRAAVAAILRPNGADIEVLLIRRAERPGDPWSGHMAFPGGHHEPVDRDLRETAVRETMEEVGLNLHDHEYLGQLDEVAAMARGRAVGMTIAPYVFALHDAPLVLRPNHEVAELLWGSLGRMYRGEVDATKEISYGGETLHLPAFQVEQQLVWGMTHGMLRSLFSLLTESVASAETNG